MMKRFVSSLACVLISSSAMAQNWGADDLRQAMADWLKQTGRTVPPLASIGPLDPRLSVPACENLEIAPRGSSTTTFTLKCEGPNAWSHVLRLDQVGPSTIVMAPNGKQLQSSWTVVVPKTELPIGTILTADALEERQVHASPPAQALKSLSEAVGLRLAATSAPGIILTTRSVARAPLVAKGETVTLVAGGSGFEISTPGKAEQDGYEGDLITVKNVKTGSTLKGRLGPGKMVSVMSL